MSGEMESVWLATQIQTRQDALLTGKHLRVLLQFGVRTCFLVQSEAKVSCFEFGRGRVYSSQSGQL
jgi:hypothetical protein